MLAIVFFAFCFDSCLSCNAFGRFDFVSYVRSRFGASFDLVVPSLLSFLFCLSVSCLLPLWEPFNPLSFFIIQPSHLSPVTRFLSTHRPFVFKIYRDTLIDKNILALSSTNHGCNRGEYMYDTVVYLHCHFPILLISSKYSIESITDNFVVHLMA